MGVVALLAVAYPFLASLLHGPDVPTPTAALELDLDNIPPGQARELLWEGRRLLILHRGPAQLAVLDHPPPLLDPRSLHSHQPPQATNTGRSLAPSYLVVIGYGSSGCPVDWVSTQMPPPWQPWAGGFRDRCNQAWFDPAGRAVQGSDAGNNLPVPRYRQLGPRRIAVDGI